MKKLDLRFSRPNIFSNYAGSGISVSKTGSGSFVKTMPLTAITEESIAVNSSLDASFQISNVDIAKRSHESESFYISFYTKLDESYASDPILLKSSSSEISMYLNSGNICFDLKDSSSIVYSLKTKIDFIGDSMNLLFGYSNKTMYIKINGQTKSLKTLPDDFKFLSTSNLTLAPQVTSSLVIYDKIEIGDVVPSDSEVYEQIELDKGLQLPDLVMIKDDPIYFSLERSAKPLEAAFSYGINKSLESASVSNLIINNSGYAYLPNSEIPVSGYFEDSHFFPALDETTHNQIDWYPDSGGISVECDLDGSGYVQVQNHSNVGNFIGGEFKYRVTISSDNTEENNPVFKGLTFTVYDGKPFNSSNSSYIMDTSYNYSVGHDHLPAIYQSDETGIKTISGGVYFNNESCSSVEFLFKPSALTETCLVDCGGSRYSWNSSGTITKNNISSIYVNGENLTASTSVSSVFTAKVWHHVVINFSSQESSGVYINQTQSDTLIGPDNRYAYIGIYPNSIESESIEHYLYMTNKVSEPFATESISFDSDEFGGFNVDKIVISTQ